MHPAWLAALMTVACSGSLFGQSVLQGDLTASGSAQPYAHSVLLPDGAGAAANGPAAQPPMVGGLDRGTPATNGGNSDWWPIEFTNLKDLCPNCEACPSHGLVAFVSYDTWKGIADGGWQNNGIVSGVNYGTRLGWFSDWTGIGFQIGGSAAAYDWSGTDFRIRNNNLAEPQGFITYGLFRKANENSNWSAAVVQDWMLNSNYSAWGQNPTLSQWRGQWGYALNAANEIGFWGTWRGHSDSRLVNPAVGTVSWRAVNQISLFAHHKWSPGGADTSLWVGLPENRRLGGNGSLGDYLIGLSATIPLNDSVGLYAMINYLHPSAAPSPAGFEEEAWNFTIGLTIYPGRNARSTTVVGQCWMPMLPVANNGLFFVDTNKTL